MSNQLDQYVAYLEDIKNSHAEQYWKSILRDFKKAYSPNGELKLFKHMINAGISVDSGDAFENRKLISYLYSKEILDINGGNLGYAIINSKKAGKNNTIPDSERFLNKLLKMRISNLRYAIKDTSSLFFSNKAFLNPNTLLHDLDILSGTVSKDIRDVQVAWINALLNGKVAQ